MYISIVHVDCIVHTWLDRERCILRVGPMLLRTSDPMRTLLVLSFIHLTLDVLYCALDLRLHN